ncbi:MAG: DUF393 domain-containing protein [Bacteroidetes bacterium]|nr:MAG: DUF393 domain-containing protein [Bacteroidota bacterium]
MEKTWEGKKLVFYDGDCGFCNRSVQFVLEKEKQPEISFCALQTNKARSFFEEKGLPTPDLSTFYFWNGKTMKSKSGGALSLCREMRFPWSILVIFQVIPRFMRDGVYDWVAARRHRLMKGFCVLPTPEQQRRFVRDDQEV